MIILILHFPIHNLISQTKLNGHKVDALGTERDQHFKHHLGIQKDTLFENIHCSSSWLVWLLE